MTVLASSQLRSFLSKISAIFSKTYECSKKFLSEVGKRLVIAWRVLTCKENPTVVSRGGKTAILLYRDENLKKGPVTVGSLSQNRLSVFTELGTLKFVEYHEPGTKRIGQEGSGDKELLKKVHNESFGTGNPNGDNRAEENLSEEKPRPK